MEQTFSLKIPAPVGDDLSPQGILEELLHALLC
jgi:hypothetical protein